MSSYIKCELKMKSLELIKKTLGILGVTYTEAGVGKTLAAIGYSQAREDVDLLIRKQELQKINGGRYGDMGFKYNSITESYDIIVDDTDRHIVNKINQVYAIETIKSFATVNRKNYEIVSGDVNSNSDVILDVFI